MSLRPISAATTGRSTPQTNHLRARATTPASTPTRTVVAASRAAAAPRAPHRLIPAVLQTIGAWLMALWAACSALWRGKPAVAPPQIPLEDMADAAAPATTRPSRAATPVQLEHPAAVPAPMRRTQSCPAAVHHAASTTPSPLSTPSTESTPATPRGSDMQHLNASFILVDKPETELKTPPKSWLSYLHSAPMPGVPASLEPPVPLEPKSQSLALFGAEQVAALLRQQLLAADTHEHQGALSNDPNNLLAGNKPSTLQGADGRWLGLARQFPTDAHRQKVFITTRDLLGNDHTVTLGSYKSRHTISRHAPDSIDAMADHLLRICDGDVRWRFQLTQLINQTLPNAVAHSVVTSNALTLDGTPIAMLGNSHDSHFEVVRRSHKRLHVNHTSVWRGDAAGAAADGPQSLPFYIDADGMPHRFIGEARQTVKIGLSRPHRKSAAPRLGRVSIDVFGFLHELT